MSHWAAATGARHQRARNKQGRWQLDTKESLCGAQRLKTVKKKTAKMDKRPWEFLGDD